MGTCLYNSELNSIITPYFAWQRFTIKIFPDRIRLYFDADTDADDENTEKPTPSINNHVYFENCAALVEAYALLGLAVYPQKKDIFCFVHASFNTYIQFSS